MENSVTSLAALAQAAGVAPSTVSRALANSPRISEATRLRIQALARQMKYRPNPFGSAMAARLRLSRSQSSHATLACIHTTDPADTIWYANRFYQRYLKGASGQAEDLGYEMQPFYLSRGGVNGKRMSDILDARGINGVLFPTIQDPTQDLGFQWDRFAAATIGFNFKNPPLHGTMNRHDHTIWLTLLELTRLGYRRIGLLTLNVSEVLAERAFTSAFLLYQSEQPKGVRVPIFTSVVADEGTRFENFKRWISSHRPDVVVSLGMGHRILQWLEKMKWQVPEDIGIADMDIHPPTTMSGVDQLHELVAAAAVDLVLGQIHRNESGVPEHPKTVMLEGVWRNGSTLRKQSS